MMKHQIQQIYKNVIQKYLKPTPLKKSEWLSNLVKGKVFLKLECFNPNGSFKVRGALNAVATLYKKHLVEHPNEVMKVVAASAGNHAQGVAYAAKEFGCEAHIFLPKKVSAMKKAATEKLGAHIYIHGNNVDEALEAALEFCEKDPHAYFINPFNNEDIILGQATCAFESHWQFRDEINSSESLESVLPDYFLCSVGGGGLAAGSCLYFKDTKTKVIGVEQELYNSAFKSMKAGKLVSMDPVPNPSTIADGIAIKKIGDLTFKYMLDSIEKVTSVSEHDIYNAIANIYKHENIIVEGAGATALADVLKNPAQYENKTTIICVSGGNIDPDVFEKVLQNTKEEV